MWNSHKVDPCLTSYTRTVPLISLHASHLLWRQISRLYDPCKLCAQLGFVARVCRTVLEPRSQIRNSRPRSSLRVASTRSLLLIANTKQSLWPVDRVLHEPVATLHSSMLCSRKLNA